MKYGKIPEELGIDYQKMLDYAFNMQEGEKEYKDKRDLPEYLAEKRGLFKNDRLICTAAYHTFEVFLRGDKYKLAGIADVSSPPENRHHGYIRKIMFELLQEFRKQEIFLSLLWPFSYAFYKRLGWGLVNKYTLYRFDPVLLKFIGKSNSGRFRRAGVEDLADIKAVYGKYAVNYNLAIVRSREWWERQIFKKGEDEPYCYFWEENGKVRSYIIYRAEKGAEPGWGHWIMNIEEFAYQDKMAYLQILRFIYYHQSQISEVHMHCPENTSLLDIFDNPGGLECIVKPGSMFRLVDVKKALGMMIFPENLVGSIIFKINDPLLKWNRGVFECKIAGGGAKCDYTDKDPDLILDIEVLSQIYAGYLSPVQAYFLNKIKPKNYEELEFFNEAFPAAGVFLQEHF